MLKKIKKVLAKNEEFDLTGKRLFNNLRIEINANCNRSCTFCPRTFDRNRKNNKAIMPTPSVLSIINQSLEMGFNGVVGFDFYNEPTLDERLFYFLDYCKGKGLDTIVITNGDLLRKNDAYTINLFNRATKISLSLYDYEDIKGRGILVSEWEKYLEKIGVAMEKVNFVGNYFTFGNRAGLIERNGIYNHKKELDEKLPLKAACKKFLVKLNVRYDGEVAMCCEDEWVQESLGNINKSSVSEIWYGERRIGIARSLALGKRGELVPCNKCVKGAIFV